MFCCVSSEAFQHCTDLNIIGGSEDRIVWDGSSFYPTQNAAAVDASLIKGLGFWTFLCKVPVSALESSHKGYKKLK